MNSCPRFFAGAQIFTALIPGNGSKSLMTSVASFELFEPNFVVAQPRDVPKRAAVAALPVRNLRLELIIIVFLYWRRINDRRCLVLL
jgi:hypothetical protein